MIEVKLIILGFPGNLFRSSANINQSTGQWTSTTDDEPTCVLPNATRALIYGHSWTLYLFSFFSFNFLLLSSSFDVAVPCDLMCWWLLFVIHVHCRFFSNLFLPSFQDGDIELQRNQCRTPVSVPVISTTPTTSFSAGITGSSMRCYMPSNYTCRKRPPYLLLDD